MHYACACACACIVVKTRLNQQFLTAYVEVSCILYRRIHADDVIVYILAHLHTALRIEGNMLDMN